MKVSVLGRKKLNKIYNTVIIRDVHLSAGVGSIVTLILAVNMLAISYSRSKHLLVHNVY